MANFKYLQNWREAEKVYICTVQYANKKVLPSFFKSDFYQNQTIQYFLDILFINYEDRLSIVDLAFSISVKKL